MSHPSEIGHLEPDGTITMPKLRRTLALTKQAREMFETLIRMEGWTPGLTIPRIATELGLSSEQVRDAVFAPSADVWRADLTARINASRYTF